MVIKLIYKLDSLCMLGWHNVHFGKCSSQHRIYSLTHSIRNSQTPNIGQELLQVLEKEQEQARYTYRHCSQDADI